MKKPSLILITICPALLCFTIDRFSKIFASHLSSAQEWLIFHLEPHYNSGVILGQLSHLPAQFRIITIGTLFAFILFLFFLISYLLKPRALILRLGLSLFVGSIAGNAWDRIATGSVLDFINLFNTSIYFNLADVFQWPSLMLIFWGLLKYEKEIWYPENIRGQFLVNRTFQFTMGLKFSLISTFASLILGVFGYTFLKVSLQTHSQAQAILASYIWTHLGLSLCFSIVVFFAGVFISHRTAGPIYAFELFVEDLLEGKERPLKLRKGDYYRHLENVAERLTKRLKGRP